MVANKAADFRALGETFHISPITARLLVNRGLINENSIRHYRDCQFNDLHDPAQLPDIHIAADLIAEAIRSKLSVRIVGDYDVDGICSTAILVRSLSLLGANIDFRIPHRMRDGYGINMSIIEEAHDEGIQLLITCDNGIAAVSECRRAKELGLSVVVTDHHEVPVRPESGEQILPPADALVNPKVLRGGSCSYPQPGICGAVVAMKLVQYLFKYMADRDELPFVPNGSCSGANVFFDAFPGILELAATATVCDVMKLEGENRVIVKRGLERLSASALPGIRALIAATGLNTNEVSVYHLGFVLGPCLNASGRLDTGARGVKLLLSTEEGEAASLAAELKELNETRKQMTEDARLAAEEYIVSRQMEGDKVLVIYLPDVHESIAGIVAGRIKDAHVRPTIVITDSESGVKGSARSVEKYNMFQELSACSDLFTRFGGHPMAAGLSMDSSDKIEQLRERLNANCRLSEDDFVKCLHLDMELPPSYLSEELMDEWKILEPLGNGNPQVLFGARGIRLLRAQIIGKNKNVCKATAADANGRKYTLMIFHELERWQSFLEESFGASHKEALFSGEADIPMEIKIVYYPSINEYRGEKTIQLTVQDYMR